ncbi:MAG: DUF4013 domain-containing protein [Chloroflexi bacterium]|nr:DUF4013 domain-containing protein [Chloroflexota bacterium]
MKKTLIACLIGILGYVFILPLLLLLGYGYRVMRHTIETGAPILPEWADIGGLFLDGLKVIGVGIIYLAPVLLIVFLLFGCFFLVIPGSAVLIAADVPELAAGSFFLAYVVFFGSFFILMPLSLVLGFLSQVATSRMAATDVFNDALAFREVWELAKKGIGNYLLAFLLTFAVSFAISLVLQILMLTIILLCLVPLVSGAISAYTYAVQGALFGTAYRATVSESPAQLDAPKG